MFLLCCAVFFFQPLGTRSTGLRQTGRGRNTHCLLWRSSHSIAHTVDQFVQSYSFRAPTPTHPCSFSVPRLPPSLLRVCIRLGKQISHHFGHRPRLKPNSCDGGRCKRTTRTLENTLCVPEGGSGSTCGERRPSRSNGFTQRRTSSSPVDTLYQVPQAGLGASEMIKKKETRKRQMRNDC